MSDRDVVLAGGLEDELRLLSGWVALPDTPPIADGVGRALATRAARQRRIRGRWLSVAFALIALLVLAAAAVAVGWVVGGIRLTFTDAPPSLAASSTLGGLPPGRRVPISTAAELVDFPIRTLRVAALRVPDTVVVDPDRPAGGSVTLAYGARPGYPARRSGTGLLITEFRADIGPEVFEKLINAGVRVEPTSVGDQPAYWVAGGEHFFFYRDANGRVVDDTIRLVGDTLIWESGGLTLRVEGAPTLAAARAVAESLVE